MRDVIDFGFVIPINGELRRHDRDGVPVVASSAVDGGWVLFRFLD